MSESPENKDNKLEMKTIADLCGYHFVIPSYQRGYRWREEQVKDLIQDIQDFSEELSKNDGEKKDAFYCLQPIVVKACGSETELDCPVLTEGTKNGNIQVEKEDGKRKEYRFDKTINNFVENNRFEVIDGQQRLTTIFLILKWLNEDHLFSLEYDTRTETTAVLDDPLKASDDRIDEWHIKKAWEAISEELSKIENNEGKNVIWKDIFLNKTQVIWYEPEGLGADDTESIKIFSRLNVGKIPLTNSELIRALFILETKGKPPSELNEYKIASEWDFIEQQLHNEEFWCFCNLGDPFKKEYPNRIEFFFDLVEQCADKTDQSHQTYSTFAMYSKTIEEVKDKEKGQEVAKLWQKIKNLYYRFHEWFIDDTLYHLIGFVRLNNFVQLNTERETKGLLDEADSKKQSDLQKWLLDVVKKKVNFEQMNAWSFLENRDKGLIKNSLLLFNLFSYQQEGRRFPWHRYLLKSDGGHRTWSLEHINAQNQQDLDDKKWLEWAKSFEEKELKSILKIEDKRKALPKEKFHKMLKELQGSVDEYEHHISNLALLDRDDNSALGNCIFSSKRKKIRDFMQSTDHFIPLATKHVFMKFYGDAETMHKWEVDDCKGHHNAIIEIFNESFGLELEKVPKNGGQNNG